MIRRVVPLALAAMLLAGCATSPQPAESPSPEASDPMFPTDDAACFTGDPWSLDLDDYARQSETYLFGQGIPISDVAMAGSQKVQFSDDGTMSVDTDVTTSGVLVVAGVGSVPMSIHSGVGGSGDWSVDENGDLNIDNWVSVGPEPQPDPTDPAAEVPVPILDFTTIDSLAFTCTTGLLSLATDETPVVPLFTR